MSLSVTVDQHALAQQGPADGAGPCCTPLRSCGQPAGQDASIASATSWSVLSRANQSVISVQNVPAPTAAGMRSEASKRITESGSPRMPLDASDLMPAA